MHQTLSAPSSSTPYFPSRGSSDYGRQTPASGSSSSSASKKRGDRDSVSEDKTASLSPHTMLSPEEGGIRKTDSAEKKRFTVLNSLERKGLTQTQKELEKEIVRNPTDANRLALEKAKLQEMESCFQSTRDAYVKSQKDLERSQTGNKRLRKEMCEKDARLEKLQKDLEEALNGKQAALDDKHSYRRYYYKKQDQLRDAESKLADVRERNQAWERKNETLSERLKQEKKLHTETLKNYGLTQAELVKVKSRLIELEQESEKLKKANTALIGNFIGQVRESEKLQRELLAAQDAFSTLDARNAEFQSTIQEQAACIQGIEKLLQKHHAATSTQLF